MDRELKCISESGGLKKVGASGAARYSGRVCKEQPENLKRPAR